MPAWPRWRAPAVWGWIERRRAGHARGRRCTGSATRRRCPPACRVDAEHDLGGALVTPGLVDCHTHLVYGGSRAREFELRLQGASYEDIARAGGGIRSTVAATRAAERRPRCSPAPVGARWRCMAEGVTTLEIKSGYGLSAEHEARCLRVARRARPRTAADRAHHLPGRPRTAARVRGPRRRLHRRGLRLAAGAARRRPGRCGRCLLRSHRLHAGADPARVRGRARAGPAGQAACRAAERPGRRATGCRVRRAVVRPPRTPVRGRRAGNGRRPARVAVLLPGAYYFLRETKLPPIARVARPRACRSRWPPTTTRARRRRCRRC